MNPHEKLGWDAFMNQKTPGQCAISGERQLHSWWGGWIQAYQETRDNMGGMETKEERQKLLNYFYSTYREMARFREQITKGGV